MAVSLGELQLAEELPALPDGWRYELLGDLVEERGICYGIVQPGSENREGVPIVRVNNIRNGRIDTADVMRVEPGIESKFQRSRLCGGEVLLTLVGTLGEVAIVPEELRGWNVARAVGVIPVRKDPGSLWLSICLRSAFIQHCIRTWATTTVQATFNLRDLARLPIPIPPKKTRQAIASVLGTLDDKIELNRRMNATLESMARTLFQSWFVDFDPVRAKLDGKGFNSPRPQKEAKGFESPLLHLFPDSFQDSELGPIPKGWTVTTLGKACEEGGGNIQTGPFGTQLHASDYVAEGIPSIMPSDLRDNRIDISSIARIREQDARRLSVYRVQTGDVVYSRRGDVERRSLIRKREDGWLCGTGCLRVRFGPQGINPFFAASYLGTAESRAWVVRHAVGATMPNLNTSILGALPMIIPPPELQTRFAEIVGAWDELGTLALEQSHTLANLRDTLLPKLLGGKVTISRQFVE